MAETTFKLEKKLLVFGVTEILSGAIILVLGVFLGSIQGIFNFFGEFSFFTFYSGYPIWGPLSFIFTGSSSIASGRDLRRILERTKYPSEVNEETNIFSSSLHSELVLSERTILLCSANPTGLRQMYAPGISHSYTSPSAAGYSNLLFIITRKTALIFSGNLICLTNI
ncbi:Membrane-spanning 4-domains subfamily A member 3 [Manis javanica]|nr:Membrane-spanning 4-domains subfamily A member 3 [Manis javanica]